MVIIWLGWPSLQARVLYILPQVPPQPDSHWQQISSVPPLPRPPPAKEQWEERLTKKSWCSREENTPWKKHCRECIFLGDEMTLGLGVLFFLGKIHSLSEKKLAAPRKLTLIWGGGGSTPKATTKTSHSRNFVCMHALSPNEVVSKSTEVSYLSKFDFWRVGQHGCIIMAVVPRLAA